MNRWAWRGIVVLLLVATTPSRGWGDEAGDLAAIEARVLAKIRASKGARLAYPGAEHLAAARALARDGRTAEARARLDAWLDLDYRHANWWVNHVPIPRAVGEVALLLRDDLGTERKERVLRVLHRAWPPPRGGTGVGANLFYRLDAAVLLALLERDAGLLREVFERAAREIRVTRKEGLQEDMSFHQHGPQFYSGSYGLEYVRGAVRLATLGHGTGLALPQERMDLLVGFLLDGVQWIVYGPTIDPGAQGRNCSRKGAGGGGRTVAALCRQLASLDPPRGEELTRFATDLWGNRCFWRSDFMVHRARGWSASTKMASVRTVGTESGNGEGLRQFHLADGACFLFQRGDEYHGIQPVWNWRRVPGTTCKQGEGPLPRIDWGRGARGTTRFVGGVTDGARGVACMDFDRGGVKARKAWFYFVEEFVCLGAGIRSKGPERVVTTINQCLARGGRYGEFTHEPDDNWVHHDRVHYIVLDGALHAESVKQRGNWKLVNTGYAADPVERDVFNAWIDHGVAPRDARDAYVVRPSAGHLFGYAAHPPVRVLANTAALQAVRHRDTGQTGIVFYAAGAFEDLQVDRPCALLVTTERTSEASWKAKELFVADPAQTNQPIRITVQGVAEPLVARPKDGRTVSLRVAR